jgi:hypothetical protein
MNKGHSYTNSYSFIPFGALVKILVAAHEDLTELKLNFDEFDETASAILPVKGISRLLYLAAFAASTPLP